MAERKFVNPDERPARCGGEGPAEAGARLHAQGGTDRGDVRQRDRRGTLDRQTPVVSKEVLPDVRALLFWLKNRRPARWRERIELPDDTPEFEFDEDDEKL